VEKQEEFELSDLSECRIDPIRICFPPVPFVSSSGRKKKQMCMDKMGVHLYLWNSV
jgi:hypothetical protein